MAGANYQHPDQVPCPNCGSPDYMPNQRCPNCGYAPPSPASQITAVIAFTVLGIPGLCLGGCALLFGLGGPYGGAGGLALAGLSGIALFVILLILVIRTSRRRN